MLCVAVDNLRGQKVISLSVKRHASCLYMSFNSSLLTAMTVCNTHVAPVRDSRVTYYMCQYQTKAHSEELNVFQSVLNEFQRHKQRCDEDAKLHARLTAELSTCTMPERRDALRAQVAETPVRDEYKRGLGHLLTGVRARSGDAVIPSQMAAFLL
jgi:predicted secreted Zn-dependent protease